ncbi:uncharacterized protein LOC122019428 [Zingiber officinale]|uniref:uncharacterized protein LOC122019428 n=1 Tax=Zingiber officinale TaxID=94328 RepID=UPI001C4CBAB0|nr:uncharacterized protein LOC122019428 [Zingiber officinale]
MNLCIVLFLSATYSERFFICFLYISTDILQKTNDEQYCRIQKTKHALQVAEEELLRVQLEATTKSKELSQAHGAWFPPWLATHANYYKELATTHRKEHGQPVLDVLLQKVSEKSIQAQQFMEPHFESSKACCLIGNP